MKKRKVIDIDLNNILTTDALISKMSKAGGFTGRLVAEGVDIIEDMIRDSSCKVFLSFPAAPIATGLRGVFKELLKRKLVDAVVTTCGTLDHDLARTWASYEEGDFHLDDKILFREGYHRLGNIIIPKEAYGPLLEKRLQPFFKDMYSKGVHEFAPYELGYYLGKYVRDESSILYWSWKNKIPVFIPGIMDGAVGSQIWLFWQQHKDFMVNIIKDEEAISKIIFDAKKSGAIMIGGGISKHHTLWWNQFRGGLNYATYITTAVEYDGSLSGAEVREAVSWGKVKPKAKQVTINGDATALFPLMISALIERLSRK